MSPPSESERRAAATSNGHGDLATDGQGVLSNLPRTRPQRSSARRVAARAATAAAGASTDSSDATARAASASTEKAVKPSSGKAGSGKTGSVKPSSGKASSVKAGSVKPSEQQAGPSRARRSRPAVNVEPAPRQGYECESEPSSRAVHPPGGAELVASVAEIVGELTKAGVATGERLLKDALSRLPLS